MEDNVMERKFGNFTLDELKKACSICLDNSKKCSDGCPLVTGRPNDCREGMITSIVELIEAYETVLTLSEHWFKRANALSDKANKYDSVRNELIRTQELLKNSQDECRKRADKIKDMREEIDSLHEEVANVDSMCANLQYKLCCAEAARKSLDTKNKDLKGVLTEKQTVIDQLMKEKDETNEALLHYHALKNSLSFIGKVMLDDQSGNHEKD